MKWGLSIGVLVAAAAAAYVLVITKPEPPRAEKPLEGTLVDVIQISSSRKQVELHAKGTVVPAKEIVLQPELGGRVIWQSPELVAGGRFKEGQPIVRIDPRDYQLAAELLSLPGNRAKLELRLEKRPHGEVAKREWDSFGEMDVSEEQRALAQREPQLESTRRSSRLHRAPSRRRSWIVTRTTLPRRSTDGGSESVDTGQLLSPQATVARLVGTDEYHVQVSVPVSSLRTIRARADDEAGSEAKIIQRVGQETIERRGEVIRELPDLDSGRGDGAHPGAHRESTRSARRPTPTPGLVRRRGGRRATHRQCDPPP